MELALSLGDTPKPFSLFENPNKGFSIVLEQAQKSLEEKRGSSDPPIQLNLLPSTPVHHRSHPSPHQIPWLNHALDVEPIARVTNANRFRLASVEDTNDEGAAVSSPNSAASSFRMDFSIMNGNGDARNSSREGGVDSDDEENGSTRKKLRLSKEQSAFLEETFKEHTTLNPKQKLALAKQLNLRPRQVEVWFQNRRARTKLKQTEVDCEYLKKCCETLTEENRRLQKELQELRALKTSQPFYMQLPATTLTMCPSCERVATNTTGAATATKQTASIAAGGRHQK
ncbi:hypothetical protein TSUD_332770 [Trifolium subterraneum]|uniref:Homeobox domain-containing protein n=1 Tax=Trifolium subterraneum TaxID=3900 RepID=A0A2Z6N3R0_TRISU|nr:hypothetical protein TSUD_332770 [Trifolium subterraneum]